MSTPPLGDGLRHRQVSGKDLQEMVNEIILKIFS